MPAIAIEKPVLKQLDARGTLLQKSLDFRNWDHPYNTLDTKILREKGLPVYKDLSSFKDEGIEVVSHKKISESTLKYLRYGKMAATGGAVALNLTAAAGLFYSGAKLFFNSVSNNDIDDSYKSLGNAYSASAVAGALTGAAHESPEWSLGNIGMGIFSRNLNNLWGLAGFSISEGLSSIGMGKVRYRDKRNIYAVKHSIFNNPSLSSLRFLMPIEQSILTFFKKIVSPKDWKRFKEEEPYSAFQAAGGGLIAAGGMLGIGSLFKNKLSEKMQSFFYLPYSLFSALNLFAFYRDGDVQLERLEKIAKRPAETYCVKAEGNFKKLSTPFLAVNNLLLAMKGLGLDSEGGLIYNMAMAVRAWGAGLAFLAFKSQSLLKFFKPDLFGPKHKEKIEINLDVQKRAEVVFKHLENLEKDRPAPHLRDKFDDIIYDGSNKQRDIIDKLIHSETFQTARGKTQVGLSTPYNPPINGRPYLERFSHMKRVCGTDILIYNSLLKNTVNLELRKLLLEHEDSFKLAGLLHDVGHIARSHLAEKAIKGHDNDEYTLDILEGKKEGVPKDIYEIVCSHYGKEKGEEILKQVRGIIGVKHPLYKAYKICDYVEYLRCGDFTCIEGFPKWKTDDIKEYADTIRLYKNGKDVKTCFTEKGALLTWMILFDRKVFNDAFNYFPISSTEEIPYLSGLDAAEVSEKEAKLMTEKEMDSRAREGLKKLERSNYQSRQRHATGGETAYCGYSKYDPDKKILVYMGEDKVPMEFLDYVEKIIKPRDEELYKELEPRIHGLTTHKEIDLVINVKSAA